MKICVLASTNGTDLQAILDEMTAGKMKNIELCFVLVNKTDCGAVKKAENAHIPVIFLPERGENGKKIDRETYDRQIDDACREFAIDLIVLVGWMRILSPWFVRKWKKKIINIHPSLLPKYPGMDLDVHQAVLDAGEKESGMTIHYVDEGVDSGEIILQKTVDIAPGETKESLKEKVQELEKKWYPAVIRQFRSKMANEG